ncbi:hypothetical protein Pcinc_015786 [Petrolisthes cinctipes]|uniref:DUF4745 domain-containing protein n=1 Tax=Petrolisthes cinctipes TaxID=88211 RepID=A0AAE1FXM0_PETCI|nr:hypothetical protein Pcinc_015786 [Petrolisthes cinctipes]
MRRSGPGGGGGGGGSGGVGAGVGGFSKPPPAPLTHGSTGRVRLHTPELNGTLSKDRFGSPREQSPSLVVSPSHPGSREKSPNPASQDLHDCSMCLSAYIQSLNTVCGTACRLSQCLSQASGGEAAREAAEGWEWVARAVGVASAAVKTQSLVLLQDAQSRQQDSPDVTRRHHLHRVSQAMLTSFLGLQYQFSALVVERFTPLLQALRDDPPTPTSVPTPVPASGHFSNKGAGGTGGPGLVESPNKDDGKNPSRHPSGNHPRPNPSAWSSPMGPTSYNVGPVGGYGGGYIPYSPANTLSPGACYNFYGQQSGAGVAAGTGWGSEATYRRWSMGGPTVGDGWDGRGGGVGGTGGGLGPFSLIANRRWSVPEASEGGEGTGAGTGGTGELYGALGGEGWGGGSSPGWGSRSSGLHLPSRDSSVTRSPSHSPSLTPDPSRQGSFISNEELEEVIDLLSLPLSPLEIGGKEGEGGEGMGRRSGGGCGINKGGPVSPLALSPSHHHNPPIPQLFEEAGKQQQLSQPPQPPVKPLQPPATQHQHQQPPPPQQQPHQQQKQQQQPFQDMQYHHQQTQQQPPAPPQQFQDLHYHSQPPPQPSSSQQPQFSKASTTSRQSLGEIVVEAPECDSQVSTPIWPPSGIAPGVTLTECSSAEEKADLLPWTDGVGCERRSNVSAAARDSATRASWPATATLLWAGLDSLLGGGSEGEGDDCGAGEDRRSANASMVAATQYRRHSTDTTHLLATHPPTHLPKTRSSDNITAQGTTTNHSNGGGGTEGRRRGGGAGSSTPSSCLDTNLQQLLLLNSLLPSSNSSSSPPPPPPPPPPCTSTSQYSLFSPTS